MVDIVNRHELPRSQSNEFLTALERQGLTPQLAQKAIEDKRLAARVVGTLMGNSETQTTWKQALQVMEDWAIGIRYAGSLFGVSPNSYHEDSFDTVPFGEAELEQARKSRVFLVAIPPEVNFGLLIRKFPNTIRCPRGVADALLNETAAAGYYLIRLNCSEMFNKDWHTQYSLLREGAQTVSKTTELVYLALTLLFLGKDYLFGDKWVRTSSVGPHHNHNVITVDHGRIRISDFADDRDCLDDVGIAIAKYAWNY